MWQTWSIFSDDITLELIFQHLMSWSLWESGWSGSYIPPIAHCCLSALQLPSSSITADDLAKNVNLYVAGPRAATGGRMTSSLGSCQSILRARECWQTESPNASGSSMSSLSQHNKWSRTAPTWKKHQYCPQVPTCKREQTSTRG